MTKIPALWIGLMLIMSGAFVALDMNGNAQAADVPVTAFAGGSFGGGNGTAGNPYIIEDVLDLQNMSANLSAHYALGNDIDASATSGWNSGAGFETIAMGWSVPFRGSLDGHGYSITGLFINRGGDKIGLFGYISHGGAVKDVGLIANNITGTLYVGGLIGHNEGGTVTNCYTTGTATGSGAVGGLVGTNDGTVSYSYATGAVAGNEMIGGFAGDNSGTITDCYSTGDASGNNYVGGFVGYNVLGGTITNCYSTGNASGSRLVGGFAGYNGGTITDCYSTGDASGTLDYVGGFVGFNWGGTITDCYSTGDASGTGTRVGGFVGLNDGGITDCYSTGDASGNDYVGGFAGWNGASGTISNSYSTGNATGTWYLGGFTGRNDGTITNSYSTGNATGVSSVGGFAGINFQTISSCFWDTETSGQTESDGGVGMTTFYMKLQTTFTAAGWDFNNVWVMIDGYTYPLFRLINNPPVAENSHYSTNERDILAVPAPGILENDIDIDILLGKGDTLTVAGYQSVSAHGAAVTVETDGSFTYDPTGAPDILALGAGETLVDSFTYTVSDGKGGTDTATVHITVYGVNYAPTTANHLHEIDEDTLLLVPAEGLLAGAQDSDGDHITAVPSSFTNAKGAIIIINADGSFSYDPRPSAELQALAEGEWAHDFFTYTVMDIHGAMAIGTVTVNVTGVNDAPGITSGNVPECIEGVPYSVDYAAIDIDGDALAWAATTNATWLTMSTAGTLSGTPEPGIFAVSVTVSDGHGGSDWSNFTLTAYADSNGNGIPDYRDPEFLTSTVWVNETVWNNETIWQNQTVPEYHNSTVWNNETIQETVWNNQTIPEYHNTTITNTETPVWAWGAIIAAIVLGVVAAITVMKGGKKPEPETPAPEPQPDAPPES